MGFRGKEERLGRRVRNGEGKGGIRGWKGDGEWKGRERVNSVQGENRGGNRMLDPLEK